MYTIGDEFKDIYPQDIVYEKVKSEETAKTLEEWE